MGLKAFNSGPKNNFLQAVSSEFGLTESECMHAVLSSIREGKLMDVMSVLAQAEMCDWIEENDLLFGGHFLVVIDMGEKVIFCECRVDLSQEDPLITTERVDRGKNRADIPGWAPELPTWEIPFWMMEIGEK